MPGPNVTPHPRIEISDLARAVLALEVDRGFIMDEIRKSRETQVSLLRKTMDEVNHLVKQEEWLNKRLTALDEAVSKLLNSKVL